MSRQSGCWAVRQTRSLNDGTIYGDATPSRGTAILANSSASNNTINKGTIFGNIILDGAGNVVTNLAGGVISAPTTLNLSGGVLQNAGTLHVGGIGTIGTTTLTGDLVQSSHRQRAHRHRPRPWTD